MPDIAEILAGVFGKQGVTGQLQKGFDAGREEEQLLQKVLLTSLLTPEKVTKESLALKAAKGSAEAKRALSILTGSAMFPSTAQLKNFSIIKGFTEEEMREALKLNPDLRKEFMEFMKGRNASTFDEFNIKAPSFNQSTPQVKSPILEDRVTVKIKAGPNKGQKATMLRSELKQYADTVELVK